MIEAMNLVTLTKALALVHQHTGITMLPQKQRLLEGRLRHRMKDLDIPTYDKYLTYLQSEKKENEHFIDVVTTNETSFFRTQRVWDYFQDESLAKWFAENPQKELKIWSGAASSGEEIYTIAICCEEFAKKNPGFRYRIHATDISNEIIEKAKAARYEDRRISQFRTRAPDVFAQYIREEGTEFVVESELKKNIVFMKHNLFSPSPHRDYYDVVFLRNVLIYFENKDQEKVLARVANALTTVGTLFIGESESLTPLETAFVFCASQVYKKG